jgi:hypothetical protein
MKIAASISAAMLALVSVACGARPSEDPAGRNGIEILGVELLAGGDLAKLSYRVVDFEAAKEALQQDVKLVSEDGARALEVLSLARLGPMKQRPSRAGSRQFVLFTNSGRVLRKGGTAVLVIGQDRIGGIPVS